MSYGHTKDLLLDKLRDGAFLSRQEQMRLVALLSVPAMLAQLSTIIMQYIDAMMVGQLGAQASAAIGLVSTTTWLFGGLCGSIGTGFSVIVAQYIGAKQRGMARDVLRQGIFTCLVFASCISFLCVVIAHSLPKWLGGAGDVAPLATSYFIIWALTLPIMQMLYLSNGMHRSSGNMRVPSIAGVMMCILDVVFNLVLIPRYGVVGAALATSIAAVLTLFYSGAKLVFENPELRLVGHSLHFLPRGTDFRRAMKISLPMGMEHVVFCGAQIVSTLIVAPLGTVAIAANAFGIIVESLCYMPGYGIGDAATVLIGQSIGAKRNGLVRSFSILTTAVGVTVMTALGVVMYFGAPHLMRLMTPDIAVQEASVVALRIEAFAEPMYAASIVVYGVFVGAGDTLVPSIMNLSSIWLVRIPLAAILARQYGLAGVWIAMAAELTVRGIIFLIRLTTSKKYLRNQSNTP